MNARNKAFAGKDQPAASADTGNFGYDESEDGMVSTTPGHEVWGYDAAGRLTITSGPLIFQKPDESDESESSDAALERAMLDAHESSHRIRNIPVGRRSQQDIVESVYLLRMGVDTMVGRATTAVATAMEELDRSRERMITLILKLQCAGEQL